MNKDKLESLQQDKVMQTRATAVTELLKTTAEKPVWGDTDLEFRDGLKETPWRVAKLYEELYWGYNVDAVGVLNDAIFTDIPSDDIVLVSNIPLQSMCAHHMMPFFGKAHVAYIPQEKVVGISKIARVVEIYMRRLQSQENIGQEVAAAMIEALNPLGVAVIIEAEHTCMTFRGVQAPGTITKTAHLKGAFRDNPQLRQELYDLLLK